MNTLGVSLVWCVVQATMFTSIGLVVYYAARRRSPAMAAAAVASTLFVLAAVSALAFFPWPRWYTLGQVAPGPVPGGSDVEFSANADGPATRAGATDADQPATRARATARPADTRLADAWQFFWDELQLKQVVDHERSAAWRWPGIVAVAFALGMCLTLGRIALGLLAVRRYRAAMLAVTDPALLAQTARITQQMGCRRPVELRQSASLNTPATIGWRRPIVILPDDWRNWSETERQVVLAHEIAHIARGDYAAWLIAQLSVALHFYHPLVHWLAGRLRLEQELAADAWAAAIAGSPETYLMTLAQMALRQDDRAIAWAARGFLPTRGAFLRRIEMLRENKPLRSASLSRRRTAMLMAVIAVAGLAIAGVRGPSGASQAAPPKDAAAKPTAGSEQRQNAFDLAYVPSRAVAVIALRPAALVGRQGMKPLADVINDNNSLAHREGLRVEKIEEMKFAFTALPSGGPMMDRLIVQVFRSTEPFDWMKIFGKEFLGEPVKDQIAGKEYYKMAEPRPQMSRAIYLPDERTIVMATEPQLQQILLAGRRSPDWADRWQSLGSGEFAAMLDLTAVNQALAGELKQGPPPPHLAPLLAFAPLWEKGQRLFATARIDDDLTLQAQIDCANGDDAQQVERTAQAALTLAQNMLDELGNRLAGAPAQGAAAALPAVDVASQLLKRGKLSTRRETVEYTTKLDVDVAETATAIFSPAVMAARESARRAQDMNNMKQIVLALHIYADVNKHFPPPVVIGPDGKTPHSWRIEILPYMEQEPLYRQYKMDEPWDSENNKKVLDQMPAVLRAPSAAPGSNETSYFALVGPTTFFGDKDSKGTTFMEIRDGTSNTIAIVETKRSVPWTKPDDIDYDPAKPLPKLGGWHPGGFIAGYGDGSVHFLQDTLAEETLRALITKAGGEVIPGM
ncbi:MAG TPA: M56 family metallopeptidase [Pirellulales bacterium]|nr:M56 family metallopeptidase [Pirellulales bacterium]